MATEASGDERTTAGQRRGAGDRGRSGHAAVQRAARRLGLTAAHFGCGANQCGACFVLIDGHAVAACDTPLWAAAGKEIVTVEGLGTPEKPHPLQRAFIAEQAMQCGYCISGILIAAAALLKRNPSPARLRCARRSTAISAAAAPTTASCAPCCGRQRGRGHEL